MNRYCETCDKTFLNRAGYTQHVNSCSKRRRLVRSRPNYESRGNISDHDHILTDSEPIELSAEDDNLMVDSDIVPLTDGALRALDDKQPAETLLNPTRAPTTARSIRIVTFDAAEEGSDLQAGQPIPGCDISGHILGAPLLFTQASSFNARTDAENYYPFENGRDFEWARRFWKTNQTLNDIDILLGNDDDHADGITQTSFSNAKQWRDTINRIPYGIPDDAWNNTLLTVSSPVSDKGNSEYVLRYRDILGVVKFLLGHEPFAKSLSYAPIRLVNQNDDRVYNEMHTADWWWDTQKKLPRKSTIVPLLFATDKTQLTQHHGDVSAWPVYLTIGNLDKKTRRAQQRPSVILLGLIPVPKGDEGAGIKSEIYHTAMRLMLQPIEDAARRGLPIRCADGHTRFCFPIIAGFAADYEEQALITGIKSLRHCTICEIPPDKRQNLCDPSYPLRTHASMQRQIHLQSSLKGARAAKTVKGGAGGWDETMWVHNRDNFAWHHHLVNIHEVLHVDILHQLLKGIVSRLVEWIKADLEVRIGSGLDRRKSRRLPAGATIKHSSWVVQLDDRFNSVPEFPNLRRFTKFSSISQWTGVEQKALIHQLLPVVAPLLPDEAGMGFIRAVLDFVLLAQNQSHDDATLRYMNDALRRIDLLKWIFKDYQSKNGFNFPKFHMLTHWTDLIRKFGAADGFDTAHFEAAHIYLIKTQYKLTNKRINFEDQIVSLNSRRVKILAMSELLQLRARTIPRTDEVIDSIATRVARALELASCGWVSSIQERSTLLTYGLRADIWRLASTINHYTEIDGFIDALAVFVREERRRALGRVSMDDKMEQREVDPSWVDKYPLCLHPSIICFKNGPPQMDDLEPKIKESVRCAPLWQRRAGNWRRDCVWVQEFDPSQLSCRDRATSIDGRLPGQLQIIVTVLDLGSRDERGQPRRYTGALIDVFRLRDQGRHHKVHGMVEVERVIRHVGHGRSRNLGPRRFYSLNLIDRSAHLVPAGRDKPGVFYINQYIDWSEYNTIYDPDFESACQAAFKIHQKRKWRTFDN